MNMSTVVLMLLFAAMYSFGWLPFENAVIVFMVIGIAELSWQVEDVRTEVEK